MQKCSFCSERIQDNMLPACIKTCPTATMYFDDYNKVVQEAKKRVASQSGNYINHIYGLDEAGGTNWIYISDIPFDKLGFNTRIPDIALPDLTWSVLAAIPKKIIGIAAFLSVIAYFRTREVKEEDNS